MSKFARDIAVKQYLILLLPQEFHNSRGFSNVNPNVGTMWEHSKSFTIFVLAKLNTSFYGNKLLFEDDT